MNYEIAAAPTAIIELTETELSLVAAGGAGAEVGEVIKAVGEVLGKVNDAIYDAGYRLGAAVASLFD